MLLERKYLELKTEIDLNYKWWACLVPMQKPSPPLSAWCCHCLPIYFEQ